MFGAKSGRACVGIGKKRIGVKTTHRHDHETNPVSIAWWVFLISLTLVPTAGVVAPASNRQ
jgi:hypothetical protein